MFISSAKSRHHLVSAFIAVCILVAPSASWSSAWEYIGFSSDTIAGGNARIGGASGPEALFYNPAGLIRGHRRGSDISLLMGLPLLSMDVAPYDSIENVAKLDPIDGATACDVANFAGETNAVDLAGDCLKAAAKYNRYIQAAVNNKELNKKLVDKAANPRKLYGATMGMVIPLHLDPKDAFLAVGVAGFVPLGPIMYQRIKSPTVPFFLRFDDGPHRVIINLGAAAQLPKGIRIGFSVDALVDLSAAINADVVIPPTLKILPEPNLGDIRFVADGEIMIPPSFAPVAGIQYEPVDWISMGLTYRHEHKVIIDVDGIMTLRTGALKPDEIELSIATSGTFTPSSVGFGVSVKPMDGLTVNLDGSWKRWSRYEPPFSVNLEVAGVSGAMACNVIDTVDGLDDLLEGLPETVTELIPSNDQGNPDLCALANDLLPEGESIESNLYQSKSEFSDVIEINTGVEYEFSRYKVSGGYAFQPTPVPAQTGIYNILDTDSHIISGGGFATFKGIKFGLVAQYRLMVKTQVIKNDGAQSIEGEDDFAAVEQDIFPGSSFSRIPGHKDDIDTLEGASYTGGTEYGNPGYPSYTIGGGYLTLGLQASMDF